MTRSVTPSIGEWFDSEQRRAALQRTAASLVHAIANPINVIGGKASLLASRSSDPAAIETAVSIQEQVRKLAQCLAEVRAYSAESSAAGAVTLSLADLAAASVERAIATAGQAHTSVAFRVEVGSTDRLRHPRALCLAVANLLEHASRSRDPKHEVSVSLKEDDVRRSEFFPATRCVVATVGFKLRQGVSVPISNRARLEPWFESTGPRSLEQTDLDLLLALSCGVASDNGGWSTTLTQDDFITLSFCWPVEPEVRRSVGWGDGSHQE
jgi:signal transduction histidine kinase